MQKWSFEETVVAFWVYCRIPFAKSSSTHPEIVRVAKLIDRTPSALNMKIGNIGRLDPSLKSKGISGLTHGAKAEEDVWKVFKDNPEQLVVESQRILAEMIGKPIEEAAEIETRNLPEGKEREVVVRQRIGQNFFRSAVLASYNNRCCISGVENLELLEACHISDWSNDASNRTNPTNGLCMNSFFHRAYDRNLLGVSADYTIHLSDRLIETSLEDGFKKYLLSIQGKKIMLPGRFLPEIELLAEHFERYKNAL